MVNLQDYLLEELKQVDEETNKIFFCDNQLIKDIGEYIKQFPGKRIRPSLLLLTARGSGYQGQEHIKAAASVELIHTASLIHDDIIDNAKTRRGQASVNYKWGQDIALLTADYIYTKAFTLLTQTLSPEALSILCEATSRMCKAELMQVQFKNNNTNYEDYFKIIENKTAFFFSACTVLGCIIAKCPMWKILRLKDYGFNYGMAFQIIDDTLDIDADEEIFGKDIGNDYESGKKTLPIIRTLEVASKDDVKRLRECFENGDDIKTVFSIVSKYDGIEYSRKIAKNYADRAVECIKDLEKNNDIDILIELASTVIERTY